MRSGRVWKFGDNINTDLMLPGPYLYRDAEDQARAVFMNNRPGWVDQVRNGDAIVGGFNYGMGSSRPAARSLRNCGVGFLLAETINGLFFRNAVNYGLLACECSGVSTAFEEGDTAELDIDEWSVRNARDGTTLRVSPVPQQLLAMMLGGGIYPVLEREGLIAPRQAGWNGGASLRRVPLRWLLEQIAHRHVAISASRALARRGSGSLP